MFYFGPLTSLCILILQRVIFGNMPTTLFFDLLRETNREFVTRTGWFYRHDQQIHVPDPCVRVQPPYLPAGSLPASHADQAEHRL